MQGFQRIRHDLEGMIQYCDFLAQLSSDVLRTFGVERFRRCSAGASHLFQLASLLVMKLNRLPHEVQRHSFQIGGLFRALLNHRIDGRSECRSFALAI